MRLQLLRPTLLLGLIPLLVACPDDETPPDTGVADAGMVDTGMPDTGMPADTGMPPDTGMIDTGPQPQSITFVHTNDEHSHYFGHGPNIDDFPEPSREASILGGVFRRATRIEFLRERANTNNEALAIVSAGDMSMGSLFHIGNLLFSPDFNLLGVMAYDVMTLGNHEFDFGVGVLSTMVSIGDLEPTQQTLSTLKIPTVVSNIRFSPGSNTDDELADFWSISGVTDKPLQRYHIDTFRGVKVGFVGYMGIDAAVVAPFKTPVSFSLAVDEASSCTDDAECATGPCITSVDNPVATTGKCALDTGDNQANMQALIADVAAAVREVRAEDVDIVVAVSHAGINERELSALELMGLGPENAVDSEDIIVALGVDAALQADGIEGINLIIGGHSHTALETPLSIPNPNSGINTYVAQAGQYNEHVGNTRLTNDGMGGGWQLDTDASGLDVINGSTVNSSSLGFLTAAVIEGVINQLMDGLERNPAAVPGDSLIFPGEQCDGTTVPNGGNCAEFIPNSDGGVLGCYTNRQLDTSACTFPPNKSVCGDDTVELDEFCDGATLPLDCLGLGYDGGTIACHNNCTYNTQNCLPHFFSLLEAALNFERPAGETEIRWVTNVSERGDIFFHRVGTANFDVGEKISHNESNLLNLVADANRYMTNIVSPEAANSPVQIAIAANGVVRDGLYQGESGILSAADLFRVVPLGISPVENTPGFPLTDFYLEATEVRQGLETALGLGLVRDAFWLGVSGARIEYDLSRPAFDPANPDTTGLITKITLHQVPAPSLDADMDVLENAALFDASANPQYPDDARLVHISADMYATGFLDQFGVCPRDVDGVQNSACAACTDNADCTGPGSTCDVPAGRCVGGIPAAIQTRTLIPIGGGFNQELKEFLSLIGAIRRQPDDELPASYSSRVPRRMCCVGSECPADMSRTCLIEK